jgi:hypothetical protein
MDGEDDTHADTLDTIYGMAHDDWLRRKARGIR